MNEESYQQWAVYLERAARVCTALDARALSAPLTQLPPTTATEAAHHAAMDGYLTGGETQWYLPGDMAHSVYWSSRSAGVWPQADDAGSLPLAPEINKPDPIWSNLI